MAKLETENFARLEHLVAETGNTFAFSGEAAVHCMRALLGVIQDMGLNPMNTEALRAGILSLFNVEILNMPDMENHRYILTPNHVSDFDALVLGLLHPKIRIVSKNEWTENARLREFLDLHFDLYGLDRSSMASLRRLLADSIGYFNSDTVIKQFLVFSQGTISDFNHNSPARVSTIAHKLSVKTGVPVVPMFVEQVSLHQPTRIVFDEPLALSHRDDFRSIWLAREKAMQDALLPPARRPVLTHKHANNNQPGDEFF